MIRRTALLLACVSLGACSMAPRYERPAPPVPSGWPTGDAYLAQQEAALPSVTYTQIFRDTRLQGLIEQALTNNRDLRVAAANIASARAQYRIQRAGILPQVDAGAGATFQGGDGATGPTDSYSATLGTTGFELDLFGRLRSLSDAALNRYFATEAAARATRLALVGDIADTWLLYAADQSLLTIAEDTVANATRSVELTRARLNAGIAPRTDLRQAELVLAQAQSDLAEQKTALAQDINALQLLVGAPVDPALLPASIDEAAPTIAALPAGLDSGILLRRPDVVQAEYQLRAANAQIGAARAALFPRISLTGLLGFASDALGSLFEDGSFSYSGSPGASYPIFRAGAGRVGLAQSKADRDAALAAYEKAIQAAFRDVSDALARRGTIADQERAQEQLVASATDNYRLSDARYRGGVDSFLQSLDAQRSLYNAQRSLIATERVKASNLVALYRALGGDSSLDATDNGPQPAAADE